VNVRLAYGSGGLDVDLPASRTTVVRPTDHPGAPDERAALRAALRAPVAGPPLRELVRPGQSVAISMCDGTRAQPRRLMIPAVLEEIDGIIDPGDVVILVATGTHRGNTDAEIRAMLGDEVVERVRVVNHDSRDRDSLVFLGKHGNDVPVWINRRWLEADVRITTGFVEPHFFAGFSGGPKMVTPGLAGLEAAKELEDRVFAEDDRAVALLSTHHARCAAQARGVLPYSLGHERRAIPRESFAARQRTRDARAECGVVDGVEEKSVHHRMLDPRKHGSRRVRAAHLTLAHRERELVARDAAILERHLDARHRPPLRITGNRNHVHDASRERRLRLLAEPPPLAQKRSERVGVDGAQHAGGERVLERPRDGERQRRSSPRRSGASSAFVSRNQ